MSKRMDDLQKYFMNILNHDLKTPVLAQVRSLNMLLDGAFGSLNQEQTEMIRLTKDSCETILDMVYTTLMNYKFEQKEIRFKFEPLNVVSLVEGCCADLKSSFNDKNLNLEIYPSKNISLVKGDKMFFKLAIENIIANSISYAYRDTTFCIKFKNTGLNTCISVIHKGTQMPEEMLDCMFDYYACNSSKNTKIGFGIKLYLALQIIKAHGGGIVVRNNLYDETVFDIIMPNCAEKSYVIKLDRDLLLNENVSA